MQIDLYCGNHESIAFRLGLIWAIVKHGASFGNLPMPEKCFTGVADVRETFTSVPYFLRSRRGDCVGSSTYLCAWYLRKGRYCRPIILRKKDRSLHCAIYLGGQLVETTWIYRNMPGKGPSILRAANFERVAAQLRYMP